ncbi:DUF4374 domain-containing protein [Zunongwangia sp.]|uniref:DUF4374 domain-containing protein n=1 Tax=Zunongwangia sp. TaxID=1965325 RepID=UPI003AA94F0F
MKKINLYAFTMVVLSIFSFSCSEDDDGPRGENYVEKGEYIITATPQESEGVADYVLNVESLTGGKTTLLGNGIEQDGTYRYYITNNNKFFSLLYGQGDPGAVNNYQLESDMSLTKSPSLPSETVQTFTNVNDDVLMTRVSRNSDNPTAEWYRLNTNTFSFDSNGQINTADLAPEGEQAFFTWMTQVGNKVYAPFMSMKACCNDAWGTEYPDQAWVAVYSYPSMNLEKVIEDDRTSFLGRYFNSGLEVTDNGEVYAFSSSVATLNKEFTSSKPSAITKINPSIMEFDEDYFFNLEEASNGYYIASQHYASNGKFVVMMRSIEDKGAYSSGNKLAVVDVYAKTFSWISGLPDANQVSSITSTNYTSEDGNMVHIGINTEAGNYVYNIDVASASANRGLEVEAGSITAISKLSPIDTEE